MALTINGTAIKKITFFSSLTSTVQPAEISFSNFSILIIFVLRVRVSLFNSVRKMKCRTVSIFHLFQCGRKRYLFLRFNNKWAGKD